MIHSDDKDQTHFLNVDFDVESPSNIAEIIEIFEGKILILRQTEELVTFELNYDVDNAEDCLVLFVQLISGLHSKGRDLWNRCVRRTANIGIQTGDRPYSAAFPISHQTIAALAETGCGIDITIYAPPTRANEVNAATSS